jgi:hypothetical protein
VHVKTLRSQKLRMLLTHRKLLQSKAIAIDNDLRGALRNFGLKVGMVGTVRFEARIRELVENFPDLATLIEPPLIVRRTLREQFCILHRRLLAIVRDDEVCQAKGNDDGLVLDRQHRGFCIRGAGGKIADRTAFFPLGHGLLVDAVAFGKRPQARLTILYCSTDRLCRCGAAMKNLSHSASFQPKDKIAPSNAGTKQLAGIFIPITAYLEGAKS